ncbi:hypothetical protein ATANTOWER_025324 [Ataeniobius toweri]|uniref:Uncharacterized protein n=1 Tax=Ataeniobius toweri TaxID=208326 RepID=A0ABU7CLN6_9TELE|nr:hypothetical protein [Ataeniobius toweri]
MGVCVIVCPVLPCDGLGQHRALKIGTSSPVTMYERSRFIQRCVAGFVLEVSSFIFLLQQQKDMLQAKSLKLERHLRLLPAARRG